MEPRSPTDQLKITARRVLYAMVDVLRGSSASSVIAVTPLVGEIVKIVLSEILVKPGANNDIRDRAEAASRHLATAGSILSELQQELSTRNDELQQLLMSIEHRREEAEHWQKIASVNEELAQSLTREIERRVREQMRSELERNKNIRRFASILVWVITLSVGALAGAWVQELWQDGFFDFLGN